MERRKTVAALYREVGELFPKLRPLQTWQRDWATRRLFTHEAYRSGNSAWCLECGVVFTPDEGTLATALDLGPTSCPHCGAKVHLRYCCKSRKNERYYFTILDTSSDFQVVRHFFAERDSKRGLGTRTSIHEVVQCWITPEGREVVVARPRRGLSCYVDAWNFGKPMAVRRGTSSQQDAYRVWADVCPHGRVLPILRRNGFSLRVCEAMPPVSLVKGLLSDIRVETLVKQGELGLLNLLFVKRHPGMYTQLAPSINICHRRGYKIKDAAMWADHIDLLRRFGYDVRNPRYVCPKNLTAEHAALVELAERRRRAAADKARREQEAREAIELENATHAFAKRIEPYLHLQFCCKELSAFPLPSVEEFRKEGEAMHHCVFEGKYYDRMESLIFSVRAGENRVATVEVNLRTLSIGQIRGPYNSKPKEYNTIKHLFASHMAEIFAAGKRVLNN